MTFEAGKMDEWRELPDDADVLPNGARRCIATARWTGERRRCRRPATPGITVCSMHGAKAPQTQRAARLRMLELVDPAIAKLARVMATGDDQAALRAVENILDRAGFPRRAEIDVEASREVLLERILVLRERVDTEHRELEDEQGAVDPATVEAVSAAVRALAAGNPDDDGPADDAIRLDPQRHSTPPTPTPDEEEPR